MAGKVLVVDDEKLIVKGIRFSLEQDGMEVDCAYDGEKALECAKNKEYDMILLDLMLPKMNGLEVCQQIREFSDVPIIMLTAKGEDMDKILGLEYGADDYITKPFSSGYLRARISSLLKQRSILREHFMKEVLPVAGKEPVAIQGDALENLSPSVPQITSYDEEFIHKIIQAVEERLQDSDFKIEDLADSMNIGRSVFYKKVKSILGVSPIELVKDMRIKRAIQLLETGNYNISQIAYMSGFSSSQYFSRVFKELKNCTPSEYKIKN